VIISRQKPWDELTACLDGKDKLFLVGCGSCATVCLAGGENEVKEARSKLEAEGKQVTGYVIGQEVCHLLDMKRELRKHKAEVAQAQAILVFSCGAGVQSLAEISELPVYTATDTLFLGNIERFGRFVERCSLCGSCILNETGGICPVTNCAKGLLTGQCGGAENGKCELDQERDCAWVKIYQRLEKLGELDKMRRPVPFKDYSQGAKPGRRVVERKKIA